jgi:CRP-like cAMP-binding protein
MQPDLLRHFTDFRRLDGDALRSIGQHVRVLSFPAGRTLLRRGRQLQGRYYLLAGSVHTDHVDGAIHAGSVLAQEPLYPGARTIVTVAASTVLHVDWERARFLTEATTGPDPEVAWRERFLLSPMMRKTCPEEWQAILAGLESCSFGQNQRVIEEGARADGCYVLREGHAVVHAGRHTFAYLMPGDFFGEDSLVTGRVRNASITMLEAGSVLKLPEAVFRQLVLERVVPTVRAAGKGVLVNAGSAPVAGTVHVTLRWLRQQLRHLDRSRPHYVIGGAAEDRALAALVLIQAGFTASAVLD